MTPRSVQTSSEFKTQTTKAIIAIILFLLTYFLIIVLAIGLAVICVLTSILLVVSAPHFVTAALGLGLASMGFIILFFLLKFIFKSNKPDISHLTEINSQNEPKLFKLIEDIVKEVDTTFPKKVYLSMDVNASVFYDSSFWSMFFPIKKNLQIGFGLVNAVNQTELKAILAHEFGHFSQESMKVGSYVYNVNQIIFNLLYENETYEKSVQKWSDLSIYFAFFVVIATKVIGGVQWILKRMYEIVNVRYLAMSREMEFHADEIAASITGYEPLKNSLLRLSLADYSFSAVINFYDNKIPLSQKSENIYTEQRYVMQFLANKSEIPLQNDLPLVSIEELNKFNKSKLVIENQWASHPSTEERIERLQKTGYKSTDNNRSPARQLFTDAETTEKLLTNQIFKDVKFENEVSYLPLLDFQTAYQNEYLANAFPKMYNSYYDNKNPDYFSIPEINEASENHRLEELYANDKVDLVLSSLAIQNDMATLKMIADGSLEVKTFDYNGKKYPSKACRALLAELRDESELLSAKVKENDINIFKYFLNKEHRMGQPPKLADLYHQLFDLDQQYDEKYNLYHHMINDLNFVNFTTPFEEIEDNFSRLKPSEEQLKINIDEILKDIRYSDILSDDIKAVFEKYLSKEWLYFYNGKYLEVDLDVLFTALNTYSFALSKGYFIQKKKLLDYQEKLEFLA